MLLTKSRSLVDTHQYFSVPISSLLIFTNNNTIISLRLIIIYALITMYAPELATRSYCFSVQAVLTERLTKTSGILGYE